MLFFSFFILPSLAALKISTSLANLYLNVKGVSKIFNAYNYNDKESRRLLPRMLKSKDFNIYELYCHRKVSVEEIEQLLKYYLNKPRLQPLMIPLSFVLQSRYLAQLATLTPGFQINLISTSLLGFANYLSDLASIATLVNSSLLNNGYDYSIFQSSTAAYFGYYLRIHGWENVYYDAASPSRVNNFDDNLAMISFLFQKIDTITNIQTFLKKHQKPNTIGEKLWEIYNNENIVQNYKELFNELDEIRLDRSIWKLKLLVVLLKLLDVEFKNDCQAVEMVKYAFNQIELRRVPQFMLSALVKTLKRANITEKLLKDHKKCLPLMEYLADVVEDVYIHWGSLKSHARIWRSVVIKSLNSSRQFLKQFGNDETLYFKDSKELVYWWANYEQLETVLFIQMSNFKVIIPNEKVIFDLAALIERISENILALARKKLLDSVIFERALARTLTTSILYFGIITLSVPQQYRGAFSKHYCLNAPYTNVLTFQLCAVLFQEYIPGNVFLNSKVLKTSAL